MTGQKNLILETQNLVKKFGEFTAVNSISLDIESNICKGLIGPNGAGKTTFFNLISGAFKPTSGKIFFKEKTLRECRPTNSPRKA